MNNPNPFVPKGSLLEQQSQRRSRLKLAVFCVLAVSVTGLVAMLIQGCKREKPPENPDMTSVESPTNTMSMDNTNLMTPPTNNLVAPPIVQSPTNNVVPPAPPEPMPAPAGSTYTIAKGDTLAKIAHTHGVTLKALQDANPGLNPTKLTIGKKINIPAGGSSTGNTTNPAMVTTEIGTAYTVKAGDTLDSLHKKFGVSVKAIQSANNLTTTKIKVGQKLVIPAKAPAQAPVPDAASAPTTLTPAAAPGAVTAPMSTPGTVPAH
jgi:LysM repeat protein